MSHLKVKSYLPVLFSGVLAIFLFSFTFENDPLAQIIASYKRYLAELPQEKVYLHLDRSYYASGETVWLKAYLTSGPYHHLSELSNTVYVELIDERGELIQHVKLLSPGGLAAGQLDLPDSLPSGNYMLRAYTLWMRNFGEEYFFHKQIRIIADDANTLAETPQGDSLDFQFFPEGGQLVNGILSKVAFKAIGSDGLGRVVIGQVLENGTVIGDFKSNHLGMGVFPLLPKSENTYSARIESQGQEHALPVALVSGIVMAVTNSPASPDVVIKIQSSESIPGKTINLLAQTRGIVCASSKVDLSKRIAFIRIPKTEFPSGIAQITALDEEGNPLAERLVYIDHQDQLKISVSTDQSGYAPRDSVRIEIETKDKEGRPVIANLSLTVFDSNSIRLDKNKETIQSNFLVSSELTGYIESPGYYFNSENEDRQSALDLLMLTQGWRKVTVRQALHQEIPQPSYRIEKGLTIQGQLRDKDGQTVPDGTVSYLSLYPIAQSISVTSGANGEYEIKDLIFFDSTQVSLQGKSKNGRSTLEVLLDESYELPGVAYPFIPARSITTKQMGDLHRLAEERRRINEAFDVESHDVTLDEVQVKGKKIYEVEEYTGAKIYGGGSIKVQVAGNTTLENQQHPLELVRGRVAGVQVTRSAGPMGDSRWRVLIQGVSSINSEIEPLIMVDDIPIPFNSLHTVPVMEIESYTVWKGPDAAIFGSRGANGAIGFYTRRGKASSPTDETPSLRLRGYQLEREFYSPKYPVTDAALVKPDRRLTLFWAPHIQTDSAGKASVIFYNHDFQTTVVSEIEGISVNGNPGTARVQYRIGKE